VFGGFNISHAVRRNQVAGRAITNHLVNLLNLDGIYL